MHVTKYWTTAAWAQYFDDGMLRRNYPCEVYTHGSYLVNVIIFLAPVSCFNQTLAEDESVNRLVSVLSFGKFYTPRQTV